MSDKNRGGSSGVDRLIESALEAEAAGRTSVAAELFNQAHSEERAAVLACKPMVYWAEGPDLMTESVDGTGSCSVFVLLSGVFDMGTLAARLNRDRGEPLALRAGLTPLSTFVADGEYVAREQPPTVFCGFALARRVAALLNADHFDAEPGH